LALDLSETYMTSSGILFLLFANGVLRIYTLVLCYVF
jgi:hypothetical protein